MTEAPRPKHFLTETGYIRRPFCAVTSEWMRLVVSESTPIIIASSEVWLLKIRRFAVS